MTSVATGSFFDNMKLNNKLLSLGVAIVGVLLGSVSVAHTQTLRQSPATLSSIPTGATQSNPWWQHLVIELTRNPSAGNSISIPLPTGLSIADTDGDGEVTDEVSLSGVTGRNTGYRSVSGTTAQALRLLSTTGGTVGDVHVQFPVISSSSPAAASATYGSITFSNSGEKTIPSGTVTVLWTAANALQVRTPVRAFLDGVADTTTSAAGAAYPDSAAAIFINTLPNLIHDDLPLLSAQRFIDLGVPFGNGDDTDDVSYEFWWSTTDSLRAVDGDTARVAIDAATAAQAQATEADSAVLAFDVSELSAGTWYLYVTSPLTGTFPLVRSRGITVRHEPVVNTVAEALSGDPDWIDSGRLLDADTGVAGPSSSAQDELSIVVSVVDHDDTAIVHVFYSATATLDTSSVTTTGTAPNRVVTGLTGATHVDSTITLSEGIDSTLTWSVGDSDSTVVTAGDYYLYAVATDGTVLSVGRSDTLFSVRHSPFLVFDTQDDAVLNTGGMEPDRFYSVSWNQDYGIEGDYDRDTAGGTIDLYFSDSDSFDVPAGAADIAAAAADSSQDTHVIVTGLSVDSDGQDENQYSWDLWTHSNTDDGGVPLAGVDYTIYGVISTGSTQRLVRWEDGTGTPRTMSFTHEPHLTIEAPLAAVSVDGNRSFGVSWEASDVDDDASIWVFLTPAGSAAIDDETTFAELQASGATMWTGTSADGSLDSGRPESENTSSSVSIRPARLVSAADGSATPIVDGEYDVWIVIDETAGVTPAAASPTQRAPGMVTIDGFGSDGAIGLAAPALELLPARTTMEAWRDTAVFSIRPNTNGEAVDVVSVFLSVDTLLVNIVDQDTAQAGTQPFSVNADLAGQTLFDSVMAGADTTVSGLWVMDLVYFDQAGRTFDGDTELATISLATKNQEGTARLRIDNLEPRRSAFYRSGDEVGSVPPQTGSVIELLPRASVSGTVRLQGRTQQRAEVTLELRERDGFATVTDSLFTAVNDANSSKAGIQDTLDTLGAFTLTQVPRGSWHLVAHVDRYLDGQVPVFQVSPGQTLTGMDPHWLRDGTTKAPYLLGGDVTGWLDTTGASSPDNEVDQLDVDFVTTYFGESTTPAHAGQLADIDGDSLVWVPDLNMVAANFAVDGVRPAYRRTVDGESVNLRLTTQRSSSGRLTVSIAGDALGLARAFGLSFEYDPQRWMPVSGEARSLFGARAAVTAYRDDRRGQLHVGAALVGEGAMDVGDEVFGRVEFEPVSGQTTSSDHGIRLTTATVVGADHRARSARWSTDGLPAGYFLYPAYPNPFNPETTLRFDVPDAADLRVDVYDLAGQRVRTLHNGPVSGGTHTITWDGRDDSGHQVASGTYFARMVAPAMRAERKMLLLR